MRPPPAWTFFFVFVLLATACGPAERDLDAGLPDAGSPDAGPQDAGYDDGDPGVADKGPGDEEPGEIVTRRVVPSDTSETIVPTIGDHFVAVGPAPGRRGTLFVFYPGTGASPDRYSLLLERAAALGFHTIGLAYHNSESINFDICPGEPQTCHEKARLEILQGIESGYDPPEVDPDNAAFTRLVKLLQYLHDNWPDEGWDAYLDDTGENPVWQRIAFGGHSQGGGHAAMTARLHLVERALLFDATEPSAWTQTAFVTPPGRLFGFVHTEEPIYNGIVRSWENIDLPGPLTPVDGAAPPWGDSHRLTTSFLECNGDPESLGFYHNCPVVDDFLPFDDTGAPLFQPVWDLMLTAPLP